MKPILREKSVLTGKANLEELIVVPHFPIFIGCTEQDAADDLFEDLVLNICADTGVVQLKNLIPLDILYREYHSEALGSVWKNHHQEFIEFVLKHAKEDILEIGGSNGALAQSYIDNTPNSDARWTLLEPGPRVEFSDKRLSIIDDFFPSNKVAQYETVIHSHVFEHMYEPLEFLDHVKKALKPNGMHIFSIPNLKEYLLDRQVNVLNFEHTIFLTEDIVDQMLTNLGFEIVEKKHYLKHSIFYAVQYKQDQTLLEFTNTFSDTKNMFNDYFIALREKIDATVTQMKELDDDAPIYMFGAHVFTQFILKMGVSEESITAILDNSTFKQGKRLYGTNLRVQSLESIASEDTPVVIVHAGQYQTEIEQQLQSINASVKIIR